MILLNCKKLFQKLLKCLCLLVLFVSVCYPAQSYAHPQTEPAAGDSTEQVEKLERLTIELVNVAELDKVARFTQLLAESPHISDLRLTRVQLLADNPLRSFVRWTAQIVSGMAEDFELQIQSAADEIEELSVVHRQSYRGFVAFNLRTGALNNEVFAESSSNFRRSPWPIHSGRGFD